MTAIQHMSDLFKPEPVQWGFRGDPYLWEEMVSVLADTPLPATETHLNELLEEVFARLVGVPLNVQVSYVFVERYSHGGMSSGKVSFAFWRKFFSLLRSRYQTEAFISAAARTR
jgi:hypothetical protein